MEKEKFGGLDLQLNAIFARLDILKQSLPSDCQKEYNRLIEQKKREWTEKYNVNHEQLDEWFR